MIHSSRRAPGTLLYAFLCAAVLLGCCCGLVVALCGPPVWAREIQGWVAPDAVASEPEPAVEPAGAPEESEPAATPDPDPDPPEAPEAPVSRPRREASSSIRALGDREVPPGVRQRLRARIAGDD